MRSSSGENIGKQTINGIEGGPKSKRGCSALSSPFSQMVILS